MPQKDLYNNISIVGGLDQTDLTATGTTNGDIVDLSGFESAVFMLSAGTITSGTYTPNIQHGDATASMSDVASGDLLGTEAGAALASTDDNGATKIGYVGMKRYVRAQVVATNDVSAAGVTGKWILGSAYNAPVS